MKLWRFIIPLVLFITMAFPVMASDITDAIFTGDIIVTNSAGSTQSGTVVFTLDTDNLLDEGYINTNFTNVAIQNPSLTDAAFMPALSTTDQWCLWIPSILSAQSYRLYTGGPTDMLAKLRYFPDTAGMTTGDAASLELGGNFETEQKGWIDTAAGADKNLMIKDAAFQSYVSGSGAITFEVLPATTVDHYSTASDGYVSSDQHYNYATARTGATGTATAGAATANIGQVYVPNVVTVATAGSTETSMYSGSITKCGERVNSFTGYISSVKAYLKKSGAPTGTAYLRVSRVSDGVVLGTIGSIDVSTLTGSMAWYTFNSSPVLVSSSTNIRFYLEYTGGDAGNSVGFGRRTTDLSALGIYTYDNSGAWTDDAAQDWVFEIDYSYYQLHRGALYFDTSSLPDGATISAASLKLYGQTDNSTTDFNITVQSGQPTYPHDPLAVGDYDLTNYSGSYGTFDTSGFSVAGYNTIALSTPDTLINKTGTTKLFLRSSRDISGTAPTGNEYVIIYASEQAGTGNDPYLSVTYTVKVTATGVTTGEHTVKTTADGANLKIFIDGTEEDSVVFTGSVPDNANDIVSFENGCMPYVEYQKITVGGTLKQHIKWENNATFTDLSANSNDATPSFRTTVSNINLSAEFRNYRPITVAVAAPGGGITPPAMITATPAMPANMYTEDDYDNIPGAAAINAILDESNIPREFIWFPGIFLLAIGFGFLVYLFTRSLMGMSIAMTIVMVAFSFLGPIPFWLIIPFAIFSFATIIKRENPGGL